MYSLIYAVYYLLKYIYFKSWRWRERNKFLSLSIKIKRFGQELDDDTETRTFSSFLVCQICFRVLYSARKEDALISPFDPRFYVFIIQKWVAIYASVDVTTWRVSTHRHSCWWQINEDIWNFKKENERKKKE